MSEPIEWTEGTPGHTERASIDGVRVIRGPGDLVEAEHGPNKVVVWGPDSALCARAVVAAVRALRGER